MTIMAEQALLSELWIALLSRGGFLVMKYGRSFLPLRFPMSTCEGPRGDAISARSRAWLLVGELISFSPSAIVSI